MPRTIPAIPAARVVRVLESVGFTVTRVKGSHHFMRHPDGRSVAVPVHGGQDMPKGTLREILKAIGVTPDEFRKLL